MFIRNSALTQDLFLWALRAYDGPLLVMARLCFQGVAVEDVEWTQAFFQTDSLDSLCKTPWFMSNLGLNDIYVMAIALHVHKNIKHGWLGK